MSTLDPLLDAWDEAHREFAIAMGDFPPQDLWRRPHPRLLSVGELAGHVAYWQAVWTMGGGSDRPDLSQIPVQSPLVDHAFRYYLSQVEDPVVLELGPEEVLAEVNRVHAAARKIASSNAMEDVYPGQWGTWGNFVQYQAFHVAYHTGQAYSVRHMLGHETEDN